MKTADYKIINGGQRNEIDAGSHLFIEYISGSGQGDQSYWCEFHSTYRVYRQKYNNLIECGLLNETTGTDKNCFTGTIDGKEIASNFLSASDIFTRIEKC